MSQRGLLLVAALLAGCTSPESVSNVPSLLGRWRYAGQQTSGQGTGMMLTGNLEFAHQSGQAFDGNYAVENRSSQGIVTLHTGFLGGAFVDQEVVDFDVTSDGETIRHVARVRNDSLIGSWTTGASSGSFTAAREVAK